MAVNLKAGDYRWTLESLGDILIMFSWADIQEQC